VSAHNSGNSIGGSILSSAVTGLVAIIPVTTLDYGEKLLSVFVLAIAAECGRRLVAFLVERGKK
jgi:hypothetical protein